jgi:CoA:oxalate CoA-transferase
LAVAPNQWAGFCKAIGRPQLEKESRFVDNASRVKNHAELDAIIEERLAAYPTAMEAAADLGEKHVPVAPILTVAQAVKHPHLVERETIRTVKDPVFGEFQVPGMPLRFSEGIRHPDLRAAWLGEHNVEVFTKYAGLREEDVRALEREGALICKPDL